MRYIKTDTTLFHERFCTTIAAVGVVTPWQNKKLWIPDQALDWVHTFQGIQKFASSIQTNHPGIYSKLVWITTQFAELEHHNASNADVNSIGAREIVNDMNLNKLSSAMPSTLFCVCNRFPGWSTRMRRCLWTLSWPPIFLQERRKVRQRRAFCRSQTLQRTFFLPCGETSWIRGCRSIRSISFAEHSWHTRP